MAKPKTLIALSGGVDSAVAALLLKQQGHELIAVFMKCFSNSKNRTNSYLQGDCNSTVDKKDAQKIAAKLNIPLKILNFEKEYNNLVIKPMFQAYKKGLTPNPDSSCNKLIKFPLLWKAAKKLNCKYIATGHYIKKVYNKKTNSYEIKIPKDKNKDQTYFLYDLTQKDLKHSLFPIGEHDLTKEQVRDIAKKHGLSNYNKRSTRGLCFIGKINMKQFLKQKIPLHKGKVLDESNNIIGTHEGIAYYTIGERIGESKGIVLNHTIKHSAKNIQKSKLFIAKKISSSNTLIVVPKNSKLLKTKEFKIIRVNWINKPPKNNEKVKVRIRHLGKLHLGKINNNTLTLNKSINSIAEGQSAVIYKNNYMLGGGEIRFK